MIWQKAHLSHDDALDYEAAFKIAGNKCADLKANEGARLYVSEDMGWPRHRELVLNEFIDAMGRCQVHWMCSCRMG